MRMISVILLTTAVALLLWTFFQFTDECRLRWRLPAGSRLPPMPPASSIRGHVELLRRDFYWKKCPEWTKKYGPVIRLKINCRDVVVLNDYNSIKKFWNTNEILRPWPSVVGYSDRYKGLNQMRGEAWSANRKLCVSLLKDLGFAKTATEGRMMEEFRHVAESIADTNGKPVNTLQYVAPCVFNNVVSFFYGDQLKHDNWTVHNLHRLMVQLVGALFRGRVQHYLPWRLRRLLVRIPFTQSHEVADMLAELDAVSAKQVQQSKAAKPGDDTKGFIHGYIKKIEESRDGSAPLITDGYLVGNVNVFLMGGTITLTATLMWHMLNFARNPDTVQARVQREIDEVVGDQRLPTWEDRKQMPYTVACIWELFRWRTVAPLGVSRACAADVVVGDFFIPKDAILLANIWAVHNDPTLWSEPNKFRPERHLDEEGRLVSQKPEYVLPFAIGRRDCPGQAFATMEIFFLITFLLQKYHIVPEHPIELDLDSPGTPLSYANKVKLRFLPRKSFRD